VGGWIELPLVGRNPGGRLPKLSRAPAILRSSGRKPIVAPTLMLLDDALTDAERASFAEVESFQVE